MAFLLDQHHLALDHCWKCGATDGAYDAFLDEHLLLCFSEPTDARFPTQHGFQIICSACSVGAASSMTHQPNSAQGVLTIIAPRTVAVVRWDV